MKRKKVFLTIAILLCIVLLIFGVPVLINELYKSDSGYITVWSGADVLTYYGAIIAAVGGIAGVFFTVKFSQKQYREDARNRIMPFVVADCLDVTDDVIHSFCESTDEYNTEIENSYKRTHYTIVCNEKGEILYPVYLPTKVEQLVKSKGHYNASMAKGVNISQFKVQLFVPIEMKNVGEGVALKVQFGLNRKGETPYKVINTTFVLEKGNALYVALYWDLDNETNIADYVLKIMYSDINYYRYERLIEFSFSPTDDGTKRITVMRIDDCKHKLYIEPEEKDNGQA